MPIIAVKLRNVIITVTVAAALIALAAVVGATSASGIWMGRTPRRQAVYSAQSEDRRAALTFDICGTASDAGAVLEVLKRFDTPATFFVTGLWAERNQDGLRSLSDAGMEIGTHGNTHIDMSRLSSNIIGLELETSARAISGVTGAQVELFRPPGGRYSNSLIRTAASLGFLTLMGDVAAAASENSSEQIAVNVLSNIQKGSIIILRLDSAAAAASLPLIIEGARNMGFELTTAGRLINT